MKQLINIVVIVSCVMYGVPGFPIKAYALRPTASNNPISSNVLMNIEKKLGDEVSVEERGTIEPILLSALLGDDMHIKKRAEVFADYINSDEDVQKVLLERKSQLTNIFSNALYLLDFAGGPKIGISFKDKQIASVVTQKVYRFRDNNILEKEFIGYDQFLKLKLTDPAGKIITVEDYFREEGVWDSVKRGLDSEIAGAMYYDNARGAILLTKAFSSSVPNTIKIEFNREGYRVKSAVTNNQPGELEGQKPSLEFHFHPDENIIPSPSDMRMMLKNKVPMLILSPKGKGMVWGVLDAKELGIRVKPYLGKTDLQARKFAEKAVREGWIVGVEVDLLHNKQQLPRAFKVKNYIDSFDSAA